MTKDFMFLYLKCNLEGFDLKEIAKKIDVNEEMLAIWIEENKMRLTRALPLAAKEMIKKLNNELDAAAVNMKDVLHENEIIKIKNSHQEKEIEQLTTELLKRNHLKIHF